MSLNELIRSRCFSHSLFKGKTNNRKTHCLATMILLTTMASCDASLLAQYIQPPQMFRHVHIRTFTRPIQALHNQPHSLATAVELLLPNPIALLTTYIPNDRYRERDEPNPASSCQPGQWKPPSGSKTCEGMYPVYHPIDFCQPTAYRRVISRLHGSDSRDAIQDLEASKTIPQEILATVIASSRHSCTYPSLSTGWDMGIKSVPVPELNASRALWGS